MIVELGYKTEWQVEVLGSDICPSSISRHQLFKKCEASYTYIYIQGIIVALTKVFPFLAEE